MADDKPQPLFELPKFKLLDQDGKEFTDENLRGKPFVACFVFTHCAGPCPMMFGKMSKMQANVPNPNVKLVSFTVDPERVTPAVLKEKAKELKAEDGRWFFLTGDKDSVQKVLRDMLQPKPQEGDSPLLHDTHFYLFDKNGTCVARYSINDDAEMARLAKDADALAK
jgi:cytochrome oxidase Cu insertion factor (SCO1/SenC/PrrC family)